MPIQPPPTPLQEALQAAQSCVQCGACMSVCPVFRAGRREELVARGKLRLLAAIAQDKLEASQDIVQVLERCLLCGRCTANCPSQVQAKEGLLAGRAALAQSSGLPFLTRLLLEQALPNSARLDLLSQAGQLAQPLLKALVPRDSGLRLRLAGLDLASSLPAPAERSFLQKAPREVQGPKGSPRLGFFVGCLTNYLRPGLGRRALELLSRVATVVIPAQGCCGLPASSSGMPQVALDLAQRSWQSFSQARVDKIVTVCGSCAWSLSKSWDQAAPGQVLEISQVLAEHPKLLRGLPVQGRLVAVHDPCHLKQGLKVSEEPRAMLAAAGLELAAMDQADACCGGGGLLPVNQPQLSQEILEPRLRDFAASGAAWLATSCSGCWLQWRRGLASPAQAVHPIELLFPADPS